MHYYRIVRVVNQYKLKLKAYRPTLLSEFQAPPSQSAFDALIVTAPGKPCPKDVYSGFQRSIYNSASVSWLCGAYTINILKLLFRLLVKHCESLASCS